MTEGTIYKYGYEDGKAGVEAKAMRKGTALFIKIPGTDHIKDVISDLHAWPRAKWGPKRAKVHREWLEMAEELRVKVMKDLGGDRICGVDIIAHSMGGPIAILLACSFPPHVYTDVTTVNAPKLGNKNAIKAADAKIDRLSSLYDGGDVIRFLPLFYHRYPHRKKYGYNPFHAHNNLPSEWKGFPV